MSCHFGKDTDDRPKEQFSTQVYLGELSEFTGVTSTNLGEGYLEDKEWLKGSCITTTTPSVWVTTWKSCFQAAQQSPLLSQQLVSSSNLRKGPESFMTFLPIFAIFKRCVCFFVCMPMSMCVSLCTCIFICMYRMSSSITLYFEASFFLNQGLVFAQLDWKPVSPNNLLISTPCSELGLQAYPGSLSCYVSARIWTLDLMVAQQELSNLLSYLSSPQVLNLFVNFVHLVLTYLQEGMFFHPDEITIQHSPLLQPSKFYTGLCSHQS